LRTRVAATVVGLVLSTVLVATSSSGASFSGTTANAGNSAAADQLSAPSGLTATASTVACRISLSWTATSSTWATGHHVYRTGSTSGPYNLIATVTPRTTTTYADESTALKVGLNYYYQVRAYHGSWLSPWSNTAGATAPASCLGG
jgi:hypothetical protein